MSEDDYLIVGRIVRPHGIKGWIEIFPLTDNLKRFEPGTEFMLKTPVAGRNRILLREVAWKKERVLAAVEGVSDRNEAEALVGTEIAVPEAQGEKPIDAYWHDDIIGCRVLTDTGVELGLVTEILRTGGHDIYAVGEKRRYLIPAVKEIVLSIDLKEKTITIKPLAGLLEL